MATQSFTGQIGNITSRYDILSTFTDYMQLAGVASDEAAVALQRVNDSILGLPIGLDESAQRLRRYQMFLGDVNDATNLTIGLQKALYAGGANEQMRTTALYEIERLLSAGDLSTGRQWNALMQGFGVSMNYVAEEMGFAGESVGELSEKLHSGEIPAREFLQALMRLGEGSSEAAAKLDHALNIYKGTIESWISNIQFAVTRGSANMLTTLDQALTEGLGKGITGYLKIVRDSINDAFSGMNSWMLINPDAFTRIIESVERMLGALNRFSASDLARGVFDNFARGIDMVTQALNRLPVGLTEQFIAFATTLAGPLGSLFKTISAGAPIVLGIFDRFKNFNFEMLLDRIITQVERLAGVISHLLSLIPDSTMADILSFGLVWGGPLETAFNGLGNAFQTLAAAVVAFNSSGGFAGIASGLSVLGSTASVAVPVIGAVVAAIGALVYAYGDYRDWEARTTAAARDMLDLDHYDTLISQSETLRSEVEQLGESWENSFSQIEATAARADDVFSRIRELDTKIGSTPEGAYRSALTSQLESYVSMANGMYDDLNMSMNTNTGRLDANSRAIAQNADAYIEQAKKMQEAQAYLKVMEEANQNLIDLHAQNITLEQAKKDMQERLSAIEAEYEAFRGRIAGSVDTPDYYTFGDTVRSRSEMDAAGSVTEGAAVYVEAIRAAEDELAGFDAAIAANEAEIAKQEVTLSSAAYAHEQYASEAQTAADAQEELAGSAKDTEAALKALQDAYSKLREEAEKTISKQVEGFAKLEEAAATSAAVMTENLNANADYLSNYNENLATILQYMQDNADKLSATDMKMFAEIASGGLDMAAEADALVKSIEEGDFSALSEAYESKITEELQAIDLTAAIQAISEQFTAQFDALVAEGSLFGEEGFTLFSEKDMELIQEQAAEQGQKILEAMRSVFSGDGEDYAEGMALFDEETVNAIFEPLTEAIAGEEGIVIRLGELQEQMIVITEETVPSLVEAFEGLRDAAMDLTDNGIEPLREKKEETEEQTDDLRDAIIDLADTMEEKIGTVDAFTAAIDAMRASVAEATAAVRELQAAIDALQDKTVTITTNFVGGGVGGFSWASPAGRSTGGPIYRDRGGIVAFKPKGTDTVPAMLTPGEFVVRREAVNRLGTTFFHRLNRLDIDAAFDRVYKHFNRPLPFMPVYNAVTNRNDNRNITVTQNIHSDHPDYPLRIASRWANAL